MDLLDDQTHDWVIDAVPDEGDHHRDGDHAILRGEFGRIAGKDTGLDGVLQQEGTDQGVAGITKNASEGVEPLRELRDFVASIGSGDPKSFSLFSHLKVLLAHVRAFLTQ